MKAKYIHTVCVFVVLVLIASSKTFSCTSVNPGGGTYNGCPYSNTYTTVLDSLDLVTTTVYACSSGVTYTLSDTTYYSNVSNYWSQRIDTSEFFIIRPVATMVNKDAGDYLGWIAAQSLYLEYPLASASGIEIGQGATKQELCSHKESYDYALYCNSVLKSDSVNVDSLDPSYINIFMDKVESQFGANEYEFPYVLYSDIILSSSQIDYTKFAFIDSLAHFAVCPVGQNQYYNSTYWLVLFKKGSDIPAYRNMVQDIYPIKLVNGDFVLPVSGIDLKLHGLDDRFPLSVFLGKSHRSQFRSPFQGAKSYDLNGRRMHPHQW